MDVNEKPVKCLNLCTSAQITLKISSTHPGLMVRVKLFANFREVAGAREVQVDAANVEELLRKLSSMYEGMKELIYDENGEVRDYVQIMVNGAHIRSIEGIKTRLAENDVVAIFPPVSGG